MVRNNTFRIKIFTGFAVIVLVLVFFSGCVQDSATRDSPPIEVTIHSAKKTSQIGDVNAKEGSFFIVLNMTIENHGANDYTFNEKAVSITGGGPVEEKMYTRLTGQRYWGTIPPNEKRTGDVIFGVQSSTENFTLRFFYHKGQSNFTKELGIIPMSAGSLSPAASGNTGGTPQKLKLTVNSAAQYKTFPGFTLKEGSGIAFINVSITNNLATGYLLSRENIYIDTERENTLEHGGERVSADMAARCLRFPLTIGPGETKTGDIVYIVYSGTQTNNLVLTDSNDVQMAKVDLNKIYTYS
jgi:hypothetical protein